jgi:hypothetical protein
MDVKGFFFFNAVALGVRFDIHVLHGYNAIDVIGSQDITVRIPDCGAFRIAGHSIMGNYAFPDLTVRLVRHSGLRGSGLRGLTVMTKLFITV